MTLSEFYGMAYSTNGHRTVTAFVFEDDETRDDYRNNPSEGLILLVLQSNYQAKMYLKEKYANARVINFYSIGKDKIDVVIDLEEQKR